MASSLLAATFILTGKFKLTLPAPPLALKDPKIYDYYFLAAGKTLGKVGAAFGRVAQENAVMSDLRGRFPQMTDVTAKYVSVQATECRDAIKTQDDPQGQWSLVPVFARGAEPEGWSIANTLYIPNPGSSVTCLPPVGTEDHKLLTRLAATLPERSLLEMRTDGLVLGLLSAEQRTQELLCKEFSVSDDYLFAVTKVATNRFLIHVSFQGYVNELPKEMQFPGAIRISKADGMALEDRGTQTGFDTILGNNGKRPLWRRLLGKPSF